MKLFRPLVAAFTTLALLVSASPAAAQYGGVSGLFVITSPDEPGVADFNGIGCTGGSEVVLYLPGVPPTASDPTADTSVPGRVVGVTTATASADPLLDGVFLFNGVELPDDLDPGFYEFHARCGTLDLFVVLELDADGLALGTPEGPLDDGQIQNPSGSLPLTGAESSRLVAFATALLAAGTLFVAVGKRRPQRA